MTTVMEHAIKSAGIATPTQMERVWRIIKDHPGITSRRVGEMAKMDHPIAASYCSQLMSRRMVDVTYTPMLLKLGRGMGTRNIATYRVTKQVYDVLPKCHDQAVDLLPGKGKSSEVKLISFATAEEKVAAPVQVPPTSKIDIDKLTVMEAKELYLKLHKMFGN